VENASQGVNKRSKRSTDKPNGDKRILGLVLQAVESV